MLTSLGVRDIVLIEKLDLACANGLGVLTGETGAGKSILLDALGLALGRRADAGLVRQGAAQGVVTAAFDLPAKHPARAMLEEQGLEGGDELVLRRVVGQDGRAVLSSTTRPSASRCCANWAIRWSRSTVRTTSRG